MTTTRDESPGTVSVHVPDERYVAAYKARRLYDEDVQCPPEIFNVHGVVDIHCHAGEGQQDALSVAKLASASGVAGLVFKTLAGAGGRKDLVGPAGRVRELEAELANWCEENGATPTKLWAGWGIARGLKTPPSTEATFRQLEDGVKAIWMPVANSANTYFKVGGKPITWDPSADPDVHSDPLPWEQAMQIGHHLLGDDGKLKPEVKEILQLIADFDVAVSFGHSTHPEIWALAEEIDRLGITKAFVDHPFSPFVSLTFEEMRQLSSAGIYMNFTFDELSPLLGIDPAVMCAAILEIGTHHVTLSSDAGEPLFPNSIECMRLIRGFMRAYGLSAEQVDEISIANPAKVMGLTSTI